MCGWNAFPAQVYWIELGSNARPGCRPSNTLRLCQGVGVAVLVSICDAPCGLTFCFGERFEYICFCIIHQQWDITRSWNRLWLKTATRLFYTADEMNVDDMWRHQMETFSALLAICAGNSLVTGDFPAQRPLTRSSDVFFYLRLTKWLSKQSWGWWFETPSRPLWRHCNVMWPLLLTWISYTNIRINAWICNYIHVKQRNTMIHPCPDFNGGWF